MKISDVEYLKVINDSTKDHAEKHWIKIEDIDSDGRPSPRAKWLTTLLDELKNKWPESFDNIDGLLRTSIVVSFSNSFLLVEHLKV